MRKILIIISLSLLLIGCENSSRENEMKALENQIVVLENTIDTLVKAQDQMNSNLSRLNQTSEEIKNDLEHIKGESELKLDLEDYNTLYNEFSVMLYQRDSQIDFLRRTLYGDALFNVEDIEIGDIVAGIEYIEYDPYMIGLKFKGQVALRGSFRIDSEGPYKDIVVFTVNHDYYHILPREKNDFRTLWFTFTNNEIVLDEFLKLNDQEVLVVIDDYTINLLEADVNNTATFLEIKSH